MLRLLEDCYFLFMCLLRAFFPFYLPPFLNMGGAGGGGGTRGGGGGTRGGGRGTRGCEMRDRDK